MCPATTCGGLQWAPPTQPLHPHVWHVQGFKLVGLKLYQTPREVAEEHYKDLKSKPFYPALVDYILSGPVVAMVRGACKNTHKRPMLTHRSSKHIQGVLQ